MMTNNMAETSSILKKNDAQLEKISDGHYLLKGILHFISVPELQQTSQMILFSDNSKVLDIDLSQLKRSNSSGLSLLLDWYRTAQTQNITIVFYNLPQQMYDIARISGLHKILPLKLT